MYNFINLENSSAHTQRADGMISHLKTAYKEQQGIPIKNFRKTLLI
jgi:hypothetical protein